MIKGASAELQEFALQGLISDPYLLSKCMIVITENYFEDNSYKLIYKALVSYYRKYHAIPGRQELILSLQDCYNESYGVLEDILLVFYRVFDNISSNNEKFLYEKVTEFIRRNKAEIVIRDLIEELQTGEVNLEKTMAKVSDSLNVQFNKTSAYTLSDITKVSEIKEEALGPSNNPIIIKLFIDVLNSFLQYKGLIPGTVTMVVAPPGRGKTTLAINQGLSVAEQGYNILHVFLGDMTRYDGLLRYLSCLSGVDTSRLVQLTTEEQEKFIRKWNMTGVLSHISILSFAADEKTPDQLIEEIKNQQREQRIHYDCIIIDYDENFASDIDSMYESGGNVYNRIALFAVTNKSVLFILAQPKPSYWDKEVIPLEAAAESSKKQKIIDLMLTLGSPSKTSSIGMLNIAKNRRGEDGRKICIHKNGANARMTHITAEEYESIKKSERHTIDEMGASDD